MTATNALTLVDAAAVLDDDSIHVWHLDVRRRQGRQPLLRTLAAYLGVDAGEVCLVEGAHGRPRLDPRHGNPLDFNWSHSGEHALIAVAHGVAPGIDLERRRAQPRALALARRFFASDEADALAALPAVTALAFPRASLSIAKASSTACEGERNPIASSTRSACTSNSLPGISLILPSAHCSRTAVRLRTLPLPSSLKHFVATAQSR